jgi:hypothetical protein
MKTLVAVLLTVAVLAPAGWATHERITEARIAKIEERLEENYRRDRSRAKRVNENYRRDRVRAKRYEKRMENLRWRLHLNEQNTNLGYEQLSVLTNTLFRCLQYFDGVVESARTGEEVQKRVVVIRLPYPGTKLDCSGISEQVIP